MLDIYLKAGIARVRSSVATNAQGCTAPGAPLPCQGFAYGAQGTRFAGGAGVQLNFAPLALRAEFEQFSSDIGNPKLVSLALTSRS